VVSAGLGEVETLGGALLSGWAGRKGEGLEDEEKPWKLPNVGFGSAGLSAVPVEGALRRFGAGFSVGAVVVMVGVAWAKPLNGLGLVSPGLSVEVVAAVSGGTPNARAAFCSGGLVAAVVLGCPNPLNPLGKVGFVSAVLSGVELGAVGLAPKPNVGVSVDVAVGIAPNPNAALDSVGLSVVAAG
jgi:hypothetical protein